MRLDKWLWCARFYKTRPLAHEAIKKGKIIVNDVRAKPAKLIKTGDIIEIRLSPYKYTLKIVELPRSRKSPGDALLLYEESRESMDRRNQLAEQLASGKLLFKPSDVKPDKRDRRILMKLKKPGRL